MKKARDISKKTQKAFFEKSNDDEIILILDIDYQIMKEAIKDIENESPEEIEVLRIIFNIKIDSLNRFKEELIKRRDKKDKNGKSIPNEEKTRFDEEIFKVDEIIKITKEFMGKKQHHR
eukprot:GHVP01063033.1.p2 GENE.GHVP01063033.1~~GHVP01063033.1.p2  ORF type:complete len:119 (+),score=35.95 GHVP01063033.1:687-1043(+)